ncbi:putative uncharacterized transporter YgaY [Burkholderiales bacterium 8X]|nr:putative uncharacterized transporter YgaY [Burkholderiales bacterium 8X]
MDFRTLPPPSSVRPPLLTPRLLALMAVGSGLSVASNYYVQPLLDLFVRSFGVSPAHAGLMVTLSQVSYLAGLVFLVPLGDWLERRRLLTLTSAITACGLAGMGLAPGFAWLTAFAALVGLTSVTAQIIVPLAAHLSEPDRRGRSVSTVMSGLLIGILAARTFAGLIAEFAGWRAVYLIAAVLMALFSIACRRWLPRIEPTSSGSYWGLLGSVIQLFRQEAVLRRRGLVGALSFCSFSVFWTSMAFMLAQRHGFGEGVIGLFGLIGVVGALCARFAGRLADAGWARVSTGAFLLLLLGSWSLLYLGQTSVPALVVGVVLLDLGAQGTHISNQSEIYRLDAKARSRLTTGYMSSYFLGGAVGSALSVAGWGASGWLGVCVAGVLPVVAALLVWAAGEFRWPLGRMRQLGADDGAPPVPVARD